MDTKETSVYYYLILAGSILGIIILYFIISLLKQQKKYRALNTEKVNIELNTLEAERKRIAEDLHDEVGAVLSSAKNILQSIEELNASDAKLHSQAITYVDSSISRMRQIARSLMPQSLVKNGLPFAIHELIGFTIHKNLEVKFTHTKFPSLPEKDTIQLYRIVQEILHNTIKHAKATQLIINVEMSNEGILIQTADNGCGYDQALVELNVRGLGLQILKSRVTMLRGEMHVQSGTQKGTQYSILIPLKIP